MNSQEKETRIKRLQYRANHRGIKEMDIVIGGFALDVMPNLPDDQIDDFEKLMSEHDRDLIVWFTNEAPFPHDDLRTMFDMVCDYLKSREFNA